jgi:hypothetical protein
MASVRHKRRTRKLAAQIRRATVNSLVHWPVGAGPEKPKVVAAARAPVPELTSAPIAPITVLPSPTPEPKSPLHESVDRLVEFGATPAAVSDLKNHGVVTIADLKRKSDKDLLDLPKFGSARVSRLREAERRFEAQ